MTKKIKLDKKDKQILEILQKSGRITNAQLAIDVAPSTYARKGKKA